MILRLAAACAVLLLALTGCADDSPAGSNGGSNGGSGDSGATSADQQHGREGAEAFASQWVETLNEASDSGDTGELRALGAKTCTTCTDFARQLDDIYSHGGHIESDGWQVSKVIPEAGATDQRVGLLMTVEIAGQKIFDSKDADPRTYEGGRQVFRMIVNRDADDSWQVQELSPR